MPEASIRPPLDSRHARFVRAWLAAVAALIFAMVLVGGATRLTESGLSIVEWKPITGVVPPLSDAGWRAEFDAYKTIPQYQELNRGMSLDEFKTIYWWEWTHRLLGRVIGAVFLLPLLFFLWRGWIAPLLRLRLWCIFALGAFQGAVGWWMVASGLAGRTSVSQYRLAFHLTLAASIYAAVLWTLQGLRPAAPASRRIRATAVVLVGLVLLQIYLGALVAGLNAGLIYNTWPLIEGRFIPPAAELFSISPAWRNLFENVLTVQFDHRMVAYTIFVVAILHLADVSRNARAGAALRGALVVAAAVILQASLGIFTLLSQAPLGLSLLHQGMGLLVLTAAALHAAKLAPIVPAPAQDLRIAERMSAA